MTTEPPTRVRPPGPRPPAGGPSRLERRRRLTHRLAPVLLALAPVALVLGVIVGSGPSAEERVARDFVAAWQRGNYPAMWRMLTPEAQRRISSAALADAYRSAAATATATRIDPGKAKKDGAGARVPVVVTTRVFDRVGGDVVIPVRNERVD